MPQTDETRDEAIRRLKSRAAALEVRTAPPPLPDHGAKAAGYGYRLMGVLIGGLFVGLGFGAAVDALANTRPWGLIAGAVIGFAVSIWMAVKSAQRMTAEAVKTWGPGKDLSVDDEED